MQSKEQIAEKYWKDAKAFVRLNTEDINDPPWFDVHRDTPQLEAWKVYFGWRLGFQPWGMRMLEGRRVNVFVTPCEWPELFDDTFKGRAHDTRAN